jgi:peptidoglycan/LPS O-acetylase OafA/YrhL
VETRTAHPQTGATVVTIQYLRALAASLVVFHHTMAPPPLQPYYRHTFGEFGVDLFFVISGYIMWTTTAGGTRGPTAFWAARIVRIVPLYWVFTTLFLAIALITPQVLFTAPGLDAVFVLKSYLFIPAEHPSGTMVAPLYTLGWTLNFEMFFYLIFGASLFVPSRVTRLTLLTTAFALLIASGLLFVPSGPILSTYTNPILLEFFAGVVLAASNHWLAGIRPAAGAAMIAAALAWFILANFGGMALPRIFAYGVSAVYIVAGTLTFEPLARKYRSRLGVLLGDASYSIYLAHPFALRLWYFGSGALLPSLATASGAIMHVIGAMIAGILGGVISFLLIERPLLSIGHRVIGKRSLSRRTKIIEAQS